MKIATLNKDKEVKYLNGHPLIEEEDICPQDHLKGGDIFQIATDKLQYVATAYAGRQHKGLGWVLIYGKAQQVNTAFFVKLFSTALAERNYRSNIDGTSAFRLFNTEGDGVRGLTINNYDGHLLIRWYSRGICKFKYAIFEAVRKVSDYKSIYEKVRSRDSEYSGDFVGGDAPEFPVAIEENFTFYNVDLEDGLMTGIFLGQKKVRRRLKDQYAKERRALSLFSYTGAFSAVTTSEVSLTTSVDLANRSRSLTEENFRLNATDPKSQDIYVVGTFDFYKYIVRHGHSYDTIAINPPSFARNKERIFSVQKDHDRLVNGALNILSSGGTLLLCTSASVYPLE